MGVRETGPWLGSHMRSLVGCDFQLLILPEMPSLQVEEGRALRGSAGVQGRGAFWH